VELYASRGASHRHGTYDKAKTSQDASLLPAARTDPFRYMHNNQQSGSKTLRRKLRDNQLSGSKTLRRNLRELLSTLSYD
jgi:hypothetical protein